MQIREGATEKSTFKEKTGTGAGPGGLIKRGSLIY